MTEQEVAAIEKAATPDVLFYAGVIVLAIVAPRVAAVGYLVIALVAVLRPRSWPRSATRPAARPDAARGCARGGNRVRSAPARLTTSVVAHESRPRGHGGLSHERSGEAYSVEGGAAVAAVARRPAGYGGARVRGHLPRAGGRWRARGARGRPVRLLPAAHVGARGRSGRVRLPEPAHGHLPGQGAAAAAARAAGRPASRPLPADERRCIAAVLVGWRRAAARPQPAAPRPCRRRERGRLAGASPAPARSRSTRPSAPARAHLHQGRRVPVRLRPACEHARLGTRPCGREPGAECGCADAARAGADGR